MTNSERTFRFRNCPIYQSLRVFCRELKQFSKSRFPKDEKFALLSQLSRALDSIILNLAEGADRGTDKDFALFLNRSHTSLNEVVACLDIALDVNYINSEEHEMWLAKSAQNANQLTAFRKHVLKNSK